MSENKTINTLFNADLPPSVDNAIKNLSDKPTASIGDTLADIWFIVLGGRVSHYAEKKRIKYAHSLEQFRQDLENSISKIPPEKQIDPSFQITAQALENAKYCVEEKELRDMFTSLITNSMNADFVKDVHPSFAEAIKQMSPLDAAIIKSFKKSPTNGFPLCQYEIKKDNGYTTLLEDVYLHYPNTYLPANSLSISSLVRLGLLKTSYDDWILNDDLYLPFTEHFWFKMLQKHLPGENISIHKGLVRLTELGRSFIRVCISD